LTVQSVGCLAQTNLSPNGAVILPPAIFRGTVQRLTAACGPLGKAMGGMVPPSVSSLRECRASSKAAGVMSPVIRPATRSSSLP
jgi:hypothetical protein